MDTGDQARDGVLLLVETMWSLAGPMQVKNSGYGCLDDCCDLRDDDRLGGEPSILMDSAFRWSSDQGVLCPEGDIQRLVLCISPYGKPYEINEMGRMGI